MSTFAWMILFLGFVLGVPVGAIATTLLIRTRRRPVI